MALVFAFVVASIGGALAWRVSRPKEVEVRSLVVLLGEPPAFDRAAVARMMAAEFGMKARFGGDPALVAARNLARKRWPEFEKAFGAREGEDFVLKAPVTRGDVTEHIWITVLHMDGGVIRGRLANEPYDLAGLRMGSSVEVRIDEIDDWEFLRDGKLHGYFTKGVVEGRK